MIIALHGAEFFAFHGFYPEEQKLGNWFVVDIDVEFTPTANISDDDLNNSVNYEQLYDIACEEMKLTKKLIETVAQAIIDEIKNQYTFVDRIQVRVKKMNPLVGAKTKYSSVTVQYPANAINA
ncbi:dihydroneopterin aldolase [Mucilaginibacter corticis]|uniref:7,8-dihydroneopterin aldolase n=1 Tax=Mucilaginibacter corticis TaxID=2597670 RepID=A0A556MHI0_9SPHI|nr:dihydroneopterin aldolase [Mucilaginibacter corticis]TSJ39285.1 dihydroneopterin aldolase [Mucilaginibacter corticis]